MNVLTPRPERGETPSDTYTNEAAVGGRMEDARVWLVERSVDDRGLVELVYATPDGEQTFSRQQSAHLLDGVDAARSVAVDRLDPVEDAERRDRYRTEVERMAEHHEPDETV
jgi:hypothetical protein